MLGNFVAAFMQVVTPLNLLMVAMGVSLGLLVGALPGLSSPMAIAVLIPLTYGMDALPALIAMVGIYLATKTGGAFSAILIRTPGTPAAACTAIDGYPLAEQGRGGEALGYAIMSSTVGGFFACLVGMVATPLISKIAIKATNADIAVVAAVGLILVSALGSKSMIKGLIAVMLGLLVSTIGMDPISGMARLTFGSMHLLGGISFVPAMIGLFAFTVIFSDMDMIGQKNNEVITKVKPQMPKVREFLSRWRAWVIGSLYGIFIGTVPGVGAESSTWMAYSTVKRQSKHPENFGKGELDGVIAPEASNNAVTGGALIPMLTLGIPGDASTAIMLGALMVHGLRPGPLFFKNSPTLFYGILIALLLANVFQLFIALGSIGFFVKFFRQDRSWLFPIIMVLATIGAYATTNSMFSVYVALVFGVIGFILERFGFPVACIVMGLILGPVIEENMRLALILSHGKWSAFVSSWFSRVCLLIAICLIISEIVTAFRPLFKKEQPCK